MDTERRRLPAMLLAGLALLGVAPLVRPLVVADVNLCYPFMTADSYDWISNGLFWAGKPILPSLRPPGLPLVIAGLSKVGLLSYLPVVGFLFLGLSTALLYLLLRERHDAWVAAIAAWFFFANDYVLDLAKYVLAETYATPFFVLAALAFVRAGREPRWYLVTGAALGFGFLFSYAATPVAVALAAAALFTGAPDLRRKELWTGAAVAAAAVGGWMAVRARFHAMHPDAPRHAFEALVRPSLANVEFYAISGTALLGLLPLPLYVWGAWRMRATGPGPRRYRAIVLSAVASFAVFLLLYDWADKRFVVYALPFFTCFFAESLEGLRAFAAGGRLAAAASAALLLACLLWNQIRYPSYAFHYLALTPKDFFVARLTSRSDFKTDLHVAGAHVSRVHDTWRSAWAGGLFDPRPRPVPCDPADPAIACLTALKKTADALLLPGAPVGFLPPKDWPQDPHSSFIRLRNVFERPVLAPASADVSLGGVEVVLPGADVSRPPFVDHCGPYVMARTR